jgi:nitroreductase
MSLYELILSRRSIRQFKLEPVSKETLEKLVNAARLAPSASNLQPLEFIVVDEDELRKKLFPCLKWAGYIAPQGNPKQGHEPVAYIVILVNLQVRGKEYEWDVGAAVENIILTAWEEGIGSCWLLSVERKKIKEMLKVPINYKIDSVIALGYPDEKPVVEVMDGSLKYWKDKQECLHVPKRKLEDIVHFNIF